METLIGRKATGIQYLADGLRDIADFFGQLAKKEEALSNSSERKRDKVKHTMAARTFQEAQTIILQTSFEPAALARMLSEAGGEQESPQREEMLSALSEVLTMKDIDGLQARLP